MKIKTCSVAIDDIEEQDHDLTLVESEIQALLVNARHIVRSLQKMDDQPVTIEGSLTVSF